MGSLSTIQGKGMMVSKFILLLSIHRFVRPHASSCVVASIINDSNFLFLFFLLVVYRFSFLLEYIHALWTVSAWRWLSGSSLARLLPLWAVAFLSLEIGYVLANGQRRWTASLPGGGSSRLYGRTGISQRFEWLTLNFPIHPGPLLDSALGCGNVLSSISKSAESVIVFVNEPDKGW